MTSMPAVLVAYGVYGLCLFTLALSVSVRAAAHPSGHMRQRMVALAGFGSLQAVHGWNVLAAHIADGTQAQHPASGLAAASFLFLAYFALARENRNPAVTLASVAGLAGLWLAVVLLRPFGLEPEAASAVLGLLAALAAAYAFAVDPALRPSPGDSAWPAALAACGLAAYAVLQLLFAPAPFPPGTIAIRETFEAATGVPGMLACGLAALVIAGAVVAIFEQRDRAMRLELERRAADAETALAASEARLRAARDRAETADNTNSELLADMSHETRASLNGVLGMANLLKTEGGLTQDQTKHVDVILDSGEILLSMLNGVLDLSKIEAGELALEDAAFDLAGLIDTTERIWRPQFEAKGIAFAVDLSRVHTPWLMGDAARLNQVIVNLLSNALKFTETGRITVNVEQDEPCNGTVITRLSVEDTGIGIAADRLERIFEKFKQAEASTARRFGGTGLGLAISKRLVEAMGGEISVASREHAGSRFCVTLPARPAQQAVRRPERRRRIEAPSFANAPLRVLAAEDNRISQLVMRTILESAYDTGALELRFVTDGRQAVAAAQSARWDVVLMDMQMPNMGGSDAIREIRALAGDAGRVPIIAVTANALEGDQQRYLMAGADDYVAKPIDARALVEAIERRRRQRQTA